MSNNSKFTGTFEYVVEKISEMPIDKEICSEPYMIGNLSWKIMVEKTSQDSNSPYLAMKTLFHQEREDEYVGTWKFIEWEEIANQSSEYKQKDEIVIRAHVEFSFPVGFNPCENRGLEPMNRNTVMKIAESEKKIKFLEDELSQLKIDLTSERSISKKVSKDLETKSAEIESLRSTIASLEELLKTEKLKTDEQKSSTEKISQELKTKSAEFESSLGAMEEKIASLEELLKMEKLDPAKKLKFGESQLKIDLMNEKTNTEKISEELKTKSADLESSFDMIEEEIASLGELLKTQNLETA